MVRRIATFSVLFQSLETLNAEEHPSLQGNCKGTITRMGVSQPKFRLGGLRAIRRPIFETSNHAHEVADLNKLTSKGYRRCKEVKAAHKLTASA
jgi:hypothetical protein